jgi:hypothetical protein
MDGLRRAVGDAKLTYLGFSYGNVPRRDVRGPVPAHLPRAGAGRARVTPTTFIKRPGRQHRTSRPRSVERALGRFLRRRARRTRPPCARFWRPRSLGRPEDRLVARGGAGVPRLPARRATTPDPRPVDGEADINRSPSAPCTTSASLPALALGLPPGGARRRQRDPVARRRSCPTCGTPTRASTTRPNDAFVAIDGGEAKWPPPRREYVREGEEAWGKYDLAYFNQGYTELGFGSGRCAAQDAYFPAVPRRRIRSRAAGRGHHLRSRDRRTGGRDCSPASSATRGVLTMRAAATPPTARTRPAIQPAVNRYLIDGTLPPAGKSCRQQVPFAQPERSGRRPIEPSRGTRRRVQRAHAAVKFPNLAIVASRRQDQLAALTRTGSAVRAGRSRSVGGPAPAGARLPVAQRRSRLRRRHSPVSARPWTLPRGALRADESVCRPARILRAPGRRLLASPRPVSRPQLHPAELERSRAFGALLCVSPKAAPHRYASGAVPALRGPTPPLGPGRHGTSASTVRCAVSGSRQDCRIA